MLNSIGKTAATRLRSWIISNYDDLQLANVKQREQSLPPTTIAGFNSGSGAPKDCSSIAKIDPDRALVSLKKMPITPVSANHDGGDVARWKSRSLAVERTALVNHFERP